MNLRGFFLKKSLILPLPFALLPAPSPYFHVQKQPPNQPYLPTHQQPSALPLIT